MNAVRQYLHPYIMIYKSNTDKISQLTEMRVTTLGFAVCLCLDVTFHVSNGEVRNKMCTLMSQMSIFIVYTHVLKFLSLKGYLKWILIHLIMFYS